MKFLLVALAALSILALAACEDEPQEDIDDTSAPEITGQITDVVHDPEGELASVFIQGDTSAFLLTVNDDTDVLRLEDGEQVSASREDLALGQTVDAWSTGEVNPSEPPQGTAERIVITAELRESPSIRGAITTLTPGDDGTTVTVLIEGELELDTSYDRASVRVDEDTDVFLGGEPATLGDLAEGQRVEAWFVGPVAESYPVQAYAAKIVILD